MVQNY